MRQYLKESLSSVKNKTLFCPLCKHSIPIIYKITSSNNISYQCECSSDIIEMPLSNFLYSDTGKDNKHQIYCSIHKEKEILNYCERCEVSLCDRCSRKYHRHHSIIPIEDLKQKIHQKMKFKSYEEIEEYYINQFNQMEYIKNKEICFIKTIIERLVKLKEEIMNDFNDNLNNNIQLALFNLILHKNFYEESNHYQSITKTNVQNLFMNVRQCYFDEVSNREPNLKSVIKRINSIKSNISLIKKQNKKVIFSHYQSITKYKRTQLNYEPSNHCYNIHYSRNFYIKQKTIVSVESNLYIKINSVIPINKDTIMICTTNKVYQYNTVTDKKEEIVINPLKDKYILYTKGVKITNELIVFCSIEQFFVYSLIEKKVLKSYINIHPIKNIFPLVINNVLHLLSYHDNYIYIFFDIVNSNEILTFNSNHDGCISCLTILKNKHIITGSNDCQIMIWSFNAQNKKLNLINVINEHILQIEQIAEIVPNTFASVSNDETILIWNDSDSNIENVSSFDKFVTTVICPLKEGKFSFGRGNMIIILDINKKNYIQGFETNCKVEKISYIENRNTLISLLEDTTVILWDIDTNQQILSITLERKNLNCLMNSNIGDIIVMNDNSIIVNRNGKLVLLFNN